MINVGAMVASLTLDTKKFMVGMQKVAKGTKVLQTGFLRLQKTVQGLTKRIFSLRSAFIALGATMVARKFIKTFGDFQTAMTNVGTMLRGDIIPMMGRLRKEILKLPAILGDATTLTRALYQALSAGVKPAKAVAFIADAAKAATAGLTDAFTVVEGGVTVMNTFNIAAENMMSVFDQMFMAVKQGKITFQTLSSNVGRLAGMFQVAGLSTEEMFAAVSTLSTTMSNAEETVVALRQTIATLLMPSNEAKKLFDEFGIATGAVAIQEQGFMKVLEKLNVVISENKDQFAALFPNIRAFAGVVKLAGPLAETYRRNLEEMRSAAGSVNQAFMINIQNLNKLLDVMKNVAVKTVARLGEAFWKKLAPNVMDLAKEIERLGDAIYERIVRNIPKIVEGGKRIKEELFDPLVSTIKWVLANPAVAKFGLLGLLIWGKLGAAIGATIGMYIEWYKKVREEASTYEKFLEKSLVNAKARLSIMESVKKLQEGNLARAIRNTEQEKVAAEALASTSRDIVEQKLKIDDLILSLEKLGKIRKKEPTAAAPLGIPSKEGLQTFVKGVDRIWDAYFAKLKKLNEEWEKEFMKKAPDFGAYWDIASQGVFDFDGAMQQVMVSMRDLGAVSEEVSIEQLTATRSMYEDMRSYSSEYFDVAKQLIDKQAQNYKDLGIKEVAVDKWAKGEKEKLSKARTKIVLDETANMMSNWSSAFEFFGRQNKKYFEIYKSTATLETIIKTFQGAQEAFTSLATIPVVGVPLGIAAAAAATAAGLARVGMIQSQVYQGHAAGGWLDKHPGGGKIAEGRGDRDDVFLGATPGVHHWGMKDEFVVNPIASKKYGGLLEMMNRGLAGGGWVNRGYGIGDVFSDVVKAVTTPLTTPIKMMEGESFLEAFTPDFIVDWWKRLTEIPEPEFDPDAFAGILHSIDQMLGLTSALDDKLWSTRQQFKGWIKQLEDMGASEEQLNKVRLQEQTVIDYLTAEAQRKAWDDINEQVAELTGRLTDFQWEVIGVDKQFDSMVDSLKDVNMAYDELGAATDELLAVELARIQAINHLIDVQKETLEEDIARRLGELQGTLAPEELAIYDLTKEFVTLMEEIRGWSEVTGEGYEDLVANATRTYELEMQAALAQTAAAKEMESSISAWTDIVSGIDDTLYDLRTSLASPADIFERMGITKGMIDVFGEVASPEQAQELQQLWLDYLNLAQEAYQRPSSDYQAIWDQVTGALEGIKTDADAFVSGYENDLAMATDISQMLLTEQGMAISLSDIATEIMKEGGLPVSLDLTEEGFTVDTTAVATAIAGITIPTVPDTTIVLGDIKTALVADALIMQEHKTVLEQIRANTFATANMLGHLFGHLTKLGFTQYYPTHAKHGGIFTGPESGYPVMLHGTEAVVPLSDGGSRGGMGGLSMTVNINESRTPRETGMAVRKELEGFLKSGVGRKMVQQTAIGKG